MKKFILILTALASLTMANRSQAGDLGGSLLSGVVQGVTSGLIQSAIRPQPQVIVVEKKTVERRVVHVAPRRSSVPKVQPKTGAPKPSGNEILNY